MGTGLVALHRLPRLSQFDKNTSNLGLRPILRARRNCLQNKLKDILQSTGLINREGDLPPVGTLIKHYRPLLQNVHGVHICQVHANEWVAFSR